MIPALREEFNRNFSAQKYQAFLDSLGTLCGTPTVSYTHLTLPTNREV